MKEDGQTKKHIKGSFYDAIIAASSSCISLIYK